MAPEFVGVISNDHRAASLIAVATLCRIAGRVEGTASKNRTWISSDKGSAVAPERRYQSRRQAQNVYRAMRSPPPAGSWARWSQLSYPASPWSTPGWQRLLQKSLLSIGPACLLWVKPRLSSWGPHVRFSRVRRCRRARPGQLWANKQSAVNASE